MKKLIINSSAVLYLSLIFILAKFYEDFVWFEDFQKIAEQRHFFFLQDIAQVIGLAVLLIIVLSNSKAASFISLLFLQIIAIFVESSYAYTLLVPILGVFIVKYLCRNFNFINNIIYTYFVTCFLLLSMSFSIPVIVKSKLSFNALEGKDKLVSLVIFAVLAFVLLIAYTIMYKVEIDESKVLKIISIIVYSVTVLLSVAAIVRRDKYIEFRMQTINTVVYSVFYISFLYMLLNRFVKTNAIKNNACN